MFELLERLRLRRASAGRACSRWIRWVGIAGFSAGVALHSPPALSEPTADQKAGARAAAERGSAEFKAGQYQTAMDLFQRAESLFHAPTHVLMIARTHNALGQLILAKESYLKITHEDLPAGASPAFKKAQLDAARELKALEPRIPSIEVSADKSSAKKLVIKMDGKAIPAALVGIAMPVDPGRHVFRATAEGLESEDKSVTIAERKRLKVVLELKPAAAASAAKPSAGASPPEPLSPAQSPSSSPANPLKIAGIAIMGVGVAGLGVGTAFGVLSLSKRSEADAAFDKCGSGCAGPEAEIVRALDEDANMKGTVGLIGLVAGGVLAGGGLAMFFLARSPNAASASDGPMIAPWIGTGAAGITGRF